MTGTTIAATRVEDVELSDDADEIELLAGDEVGVDDDVVNDGDDGGNRTGTDREGRFVGCDGMRLGTNEGETEGNFDTISVGRKVSMRC
jgi:hypothetical protein